MPQFVILHHDWPQPHFDLLLENGASLLAFRLPKLPEGAERLTVTRLFDHRRLYLTYEGVVPGGKGQVVRRVSGTWRLISQSALEWRFELTTPSAGWLATLTGPAAGWLSPIRHPGEATREGGAGVLALTPLPTDLPSTPQSA